MNIVPIRPQSAAERHVQFSEFVEVRHITPTETEPVQPSLYAQRLERALRSHASVEVVTPRPTPSLPVQAYKNTMHRAALVFAALILPSFFCLVLGPIGLIAPAVLTSLTLTCALLAGKPTEEMEIESAIRSVEAREYDPR